VGRAFVYAMVGVVACAWGSARGDSADDSRASDVAMEVEVLRALSDLEATGDQVQQIGDAGTEAVGKARAEDTDAIDKTADGDRFVQTVLLGLRGALISGDSEKIDSWEKQMGDVEQETAISLAPRIKPSQKSLGEAEKIVRGFSGQQIAGFIAQRSEEVPDPVDLMEAAMTQCRGMKDDDFKQFSADVAEQIGVLVGGPGPRANRVAADVMPMLRFAHAMPDDTFESRRADLDDEVKKLLKANSTMVLRHWVDWEIAEILSNPQLGAAVLEKDSWTDGGTK
jgi:hypothetical protein